MDELEKLAEHTTAEMVKAGAIDADWAAYFYAGLMDKLSAAFRAGPQASQIAATRPTGQNVARVGPTANPNVQKAIARGDVIPDRQSSGYAAQQALKRTTPAPTNTMPIGRRSGRFNPAAAF